MSAVKAQLLVVDDDAALRESLGERLSTMGHRVRGAADGFSALLAIRQEIPDVLICDLNMPRMSGFELLSVVRRRFPSIRVIAMSGVFEKDRIPEGVASDAFYEKGTSFGNLLLTIEALSDPGLATMDDNREGVTPIWIEWNDSRDPQGAEVTINCPECFRTFRQVIKTESGVIEATSCVHCGGTIYYAIVPS